MSSSIKIGDQGHVCFLVLEPKVSHREKTELRDASGNIQYVDGDDRKGPIMTERDAFTAETFPTGETRCQWARVTHVTPAGDGSLESLSLTGVNDSGESRRWLGVLAAAKPRARLEDPAGHVYHPTDACPWER